MTSLSKIQVRRQTDEIKTLLLQDKPAAKPLARLYTDLRLEAKYEQIVEVYQQLKIYVPQKEEELLHPDVAQAFLSLGKTIQAQRLIKRLMTACPNNPETRKLARAIELRRESNLPPYTALASLSKYASRKKPTKQTTQKIPIAWQQALQEITPQHLQELGYFAKKTQLARAPKAFREDLNQLFDEMMLNFLFDNRRAMVVLAGALLELLLAIHLQNKLKIKKIAISGKPPRQVFDLSLHDLIIVYTEKQILPEHLLRLGRVARVQRNFIHPGKELLENTSLTSAGARVCVLAALEVIDALV